MKSSFSIMALCAAVLCATLLLSAVAVLVGCGLFTPPLQLTTPAFISRARAYETTQGVTIACATCGASIRYTSDGTGPTAEKGKLYSGPLAIAAAATVKAIAYKGGMDDSSVASAAYTISLPAVTIGLTVGTGGGTMENPLGAMLEVPAGALAEPAWYGRQGLRKPLYRSVVMWAPAAPSR